MEMEETDICFRSLFAFSRSWMTADDRQFVQQVLGLFDFVIQERVRGARPSPGTSLLDDSNSARSSVSAALCFLKNPNPVLGMAKKIASVRPSGAIAMMLVPRKSRRQWKAVRSWTCSVIAPRSLRFQVQVPQEKGPDS